jgi:hypothetical protein
MYKKTAGRDSIWALPSLLIRRPTISSPRLHRGEVLSRCSPTKSHLVQYCTSVISNDRPTVVFVTRLVVSQLGASPRHFHSAAVVLCPLDYTSTKILERNMSVRTAFFSTNPLRTVTRGNFPAQTLRCNVFHKKAVRYNNIKIKESVSKYELI